MIVTIIRLDSHPVGGTIGALRVNGVPICWTLEPYLYDNAPNVSAIPPQPYVIRPYHSERYGDTWTVTQVPKRTSILFHAGNKATDTQGCILPGSEIGEYGGKATLLNSRKALNRLLAMLAGEAEAKLLIKEVF